MRLPNEPDLTSALPPEEVLKRVRRLQIRARRLIHKLFLGDYRSVFRGRGLEFDEVREYQPGDDVRTIDWNVTARMSGPYVKKYVEERELTVYFLVDASPSSDFSSAASTKRELSAEIATLLAFAAEANNDRTGLITFSDEIEVHLPPRKGLQHVLRMTRDILYHSQHGRATDISVAANFLMNVERRPSVAFLISDFHAHGYEASLKLLAQKHDVIAVSLTDPREMELPKVGLVNLRDPESGQTMMIDTDDWEERRRFATARSEAVVRRRRNLAALGVEEIALITNESYLGPLTSFFRARAGRAQRSG